MNINASNEWSQLRVKLRAVAGAVAVKLIEPRPGRLLLTDRTPSVVQFYKPAPRIGMLSNAVFLSGKGGSVSYYMTS
jgi:hypothetical protein